MKIMNRNLEKKLWSSEISEIIELDDSVTVDHSSTPEIICLDDSANRSIPENASKFLRVRAEVDLTNELTRIKDYSDKCVTIPNIQTKRKSGDEIEAQRKVKSAKLNNCTTACDETVTIVDDISVDCDLFESQTTKKEESWGKASTSSRNVNGVKSSCDINVLPEASYAQSIAAACLASLEEKLKAKARFTPYQSIFKSCAATSELLTTGATDHVPEPLTKNKRRKKKQKERKNARNKLNDSDCILIESESHGSSSSMDGLHNSTKTRSDGYVNGLVNDSRSGSSSSETPSNTCAFSSIQSTSTSHSKHRTFDSSDIILKQDKILLCSSENSKNDNKEVVVVLDDGQLEREKSNALNIGKNVCLPTDSVSWKGLRPVIIDGSNVAFSHGLSTLGEKKFSCKGIEICIKYFTDRGHKVIAFVPLFRKSNPYTIQSEILGKLAEQGHITFTPSRRVNSKLSVPYDDRYIVQCAVALGGVIVSSDNYRDLLNENEAWRSTIENRLLMFTFVGDMLMFPQDPLGRNGPNLDEFLRFPEE